VRTTTTVDSPIGALTLLAVDGVLRGLYMHDNDRTPAIVAGATPDARPFAAVLEQLDAYFRGELTRFDVPLALHGTAFQRAVWAALLDIPYGATTSYGALAARIGKPAASRAVGLANGRNPISLIVPCHRVIGANGRLVGYGGGLARKQQLLALEQGTAPLL